MTVWTLRFRDTERHAIIHEEFFSSHFLAVQALDEIKELMKAHKGKGSYYFDDEFAEYENGDESHTVCIEEVDVLEA